LSAFRVAEATHPALAFSRRLMAIFGTVVDPSTGFDENVSDVCQFGNFCLRRRVAAQPVGDDLARHFGTRRQHALEKPLGRRLVAPLLQKNIEFGAVLIDCAPQ